LKARLWPGGQLIGSSALVDVTAIASMMRLIGMSARSSS
jgi:hypothetical protein